MVKNSTLSEQGYVAYQIKGNHECSNMIANILPADLLPPPPTTLGIGSIDQNSTFSEHDDFANQIKLNHKVRNMVANNLLADLRTLGYGVKR